MLILIAPVLSLCALAVWLSSPGSIIFRQRRVGRGGKTFVMFKFRTMIASNGGLLVTAANDCRITPIGRFLRKFKLDELPEIYNVLRGDMSFVGPRPEVPEYVDLTKPEWREILNARPGITDPVTLRLRNEEAFLAGVECKETFYRDVIQPFKLNGYLKYVRNRTLITDFLVLLQTVKVVLFPKSAPPPTPEELRLSFIE